MMRQAGPGPVARIFQIQGGLSSGFNRLHHLQQAGYRVLVAEDAIVAGRHVLETPPDLMILDIEMPFMNGIDFLRLLKEEDRKSTRLNSSHT